MGGNTLLLCLFNRLLLCVSNTEICRSLNHGCNWCISIESEPLNNEQIFQSVRITLCAIIFQVDIVNITVNIHLRSHIVLKAKRCDAHDVTTVITLDIGVKGTKSLKTDHQHLHELLHSHVIAWFLRENTVISTRCNRNSTVFTGFLVHSQWNLTDSFRFITQTGEHSFNFKHGVSVESAVITYPGDINDNGTITHFCLRWCCTLTFSSV